MTRSTRRELHRQIPMSDIGRRCLIDAVNLLERAAKRRIRMDAGATADGLRIRQDAKTALMLLRAAQGWAISQD